MPNTPEPSRPSTGRRAPDPTTILEAAAASAAAFLSNGASASEAAESALQVAAAGGLAPVTVCPAYSEVSVYWTDDEEHTYAGTRSVPPRSFDYGRLAAVMEVVDRVRAGRLGPDEAASALRRVQGRPGRFPWWATRLATGAAGAMASVLFGGGPAVAAGAFLANIVVDWLFTTLVRRGWPSFFVQSAVGVFAVAVAAALQALAPGTSPAVVVVAVIIVALAGMTSTGAVQDAITGWYINAAGRILEGIMNTAGLVAGVQLGLLMAHGLGLPLQVGRSVGIGAFPLPVVLAAAALVALGFGIASQTPPLAFAPTALLAALSYAAFSTVIPIAGGVWAAAAAAFISGLLSVAVSNRLRIPTMAVATCAILPMLPGLQLYQGLLGISGLAVGPGSPLIDAVGTAMALAAGISFGEYSGVMLWRVLRVVVGRAFVPLFGGPSGNKDIDRRKARPSR